MSARGGRVFRVELRIRNERTHRAVQRATHTNPTLPTRISGGIGLVVRHVKGVVVANKQSAGSAELMPLVQVHAILIEYLDPVVVPVGDE